MIRFDHVLFMSELGTGAYRAIREGELVKPDDVIVIDGVPHIPARAYKGDTLPIQRAGESLAIPTSGAPTTQPQGVFERSNTGAWKPKLPPPPKV